MITRLFALLWAVWWPAAPEPAAVSCAWRAAPASSAQAYFTLSLAQQNQEIENQYITNAQRYARVLQYLNYDLAQDVFLSTPGRPDSVAASAVSYPRQYGATGRSSVLLVFPVPVRQLRAGCRVTFRGEQLGLGTRRFVFTAQDLKAARQGHPTAN